MNGLLGSPVLEVAVGLIFIYLLLGLMCTTLNEWLLSYFLRLRPRLLSCVLDNLLSNQGTEVGNLRDQFFHHPLIAKIGMASGARGPSYLSAATFSKAIIDLVTPAAQPAIGFGDLENGVIALPDGEVKRTLVALMSDTGGDMEKFRRSIENWYDEAMDRATGIFKRRSQAWAVFVASLLTLLTNADTLAISRKLWQNPSLRAEAVKFAEQRGEMPRPTVPVEYRDPDDPLTPSVAKEPQDDPTTEEQNILGELIGWERPITNYSIGELLRHVPGWFLTTVAVSLGAPFWFDVLNRFMKLRNTGHVPPKAEEQEQAKWVVASR